MLNFFYKLIKDERGFAKEILFLLIIFIILAIYNTIQDESMFGKQRIFTEKMYITSLEDKLALSDSTFILGTGTIDQELYYFVRVIKSENPLTTTVIKIKASECDLIEKDIDKPYFYRKVEKYYSILDGGIVEKVLEEYLVVPKGTIKKEFNGSPNI
ncbi:hypothetical protein V7D15_07055 [Thermoanaerobacter thermohydrosulfuricus]